MFKQHMEAFWAFEFYYLKKIYVVLGLLLKIKTDI